MTILDQPRPVRVPAPPLRGADLAWAVIDQISLSPERWDQKTWLRHEGCGTVGCFAGWACLLAGDQPDFGDQEWLVVDADFCVRSTDASSVRLPDGSREGVFDRAADLLDITYGQADLLFYGGNDLHDLHRFVVMFFGPRPGAT